MRCATSKLCTDERARKGWRMIYSGSQMGEAIALSSPSGRMSKRSRRQALKRLHDSLFPDGIPGPQPIQRTERERDLERAKFLREMAGRGMCKRKFIKEAERLEAKHK